MLTVSIDDEPRKEIRLAMDEAIGGRVDFERRAKPDGRVEAPAHERFVGNVIAVRQHPQRNLGSIAEQRAAERTAAAPAAHLHDVAARRLHVGDIGAINPRMAAVQTLFTARGNDDARHHSYQLSAISFQLSAFSFQLSAIS